jgi:hypothetical protein
VQAPPLIVGCLQGIRQRRSDIGAALPCELLCATGSVKLILDIREEREWMPGHEPKEQEGRGDRAAILGTGSASAQMYAHRA